MKTPEGTARPQATDLSGGFAGRLTALRGWRRRGAAFLLGLLAALALPPLYLFPLLVVGLTGLVWLIDSRRPGLASFSAGWWWGFGHLSSPSTGSPNPSWSIRCASPG
jgi:hypothetical protein